jgi:DNA processing protein
MKDMNNTQIIALKKLITNGQIMALYNNCEECLGEKPSNARDLLKIISILCKQGVIDRKVTLWEMNKAMSDAEKIVEESAEKGIGIVSYYDNHFPKIFKTLKKNGKDAYPLLLYYKGDIMNVSRMCAVAIIGTRNPTTDGVQMGEYYGEYFAKEGFNIVSGLAAGCDTAAHTGALRTKGFTTAFVATGLDIVHPPQNEVLIEKIIASNGAIISEYPIGVPVSYQNLVERTRLQAGLADVVILIQSDLKKGGSMHAVNVAIENVKPVYAVKFDSKQANSHPMSQGNIQLFKDKKAIALTLDNVKEVAKTMYRK